MTPVSRRADSAAWESGERAISAAPIPSVRALDVRWARSTAAVLPRSRAAETVTPSISIAWASRVMSSGVVAPGSTETPVTVLVR